MTPAEVVAEVVGWLAVASATAMVLGASFGALRAGRKG